MLRASAFVLLGWAGGSPSPAHQEGLCWLAVGRQFPKTVSGAEGMVLRNTVAWEGRQTDAEGPTEGRNFISPFVVPIRKSNMAMSTMLSSRLPLL